MKSIFLLACCVVYSCFLLAQDSTDTGKHALRQTDTSHIKHITKPGSGKLIRPEGKKIEYYKDTIRLARRKFDSSLFTNINVSSTSDYAEDLGKVYEVLSDIPSTISSFVNLRGIENSLDKEDSVLDIVRERLSRGEQTFNVHNLETINTLLDALDRNTDNYTETLNQYDSVLDDVRDQITELRKDTLMLHIFRDTALKNTFQSQLQQLKTKWREVDSLVTENGQLINTLKFQSAAHAISIGELINKVDMSLRTVGSKALHKELPYLWEPQPPNLNLPEENFRESFNNEQELTRFYFDNTRNNRLWLLFTGILFFFWVSSNFRTLRHLKKMEAIESLHISYIHPAPYAASLIFMLSLAPFFDFHAPAIYIEFIQFLLIVVVTFILRTRVEPRLLYGWFLFIALFLIIPVCRIFGMDAVAQRWMNLITDIASVVLGFYFLFHLGKKANNWVFFAIGLYIFLNLLAIVCNLLSRVTLSQILGYAAGYSFAQTISLGVFVQLVVESFLLQVQTSRMRKNYPQSFDSTVITASMKRLSIIVAIILWLIVFTINLDLFDTLNDRLTDLFTKTRQVGNFSFTFGGILLFLGIIWFANFLQKYIAYFFGDTGDDASFDDKGQRSRLMVTRLILLTAGFLLAVAASGLAVDRITVILGALGVGVGLGLQSIVNNFVSGIILIFDRPLRIGDSVDIGGKKGRVKEISIRSSTLLTEEGAEIIIPNGDVLSQSIINWTLSNNHARVAQTFAIKKPDNPENFDLKAISNLITGNHNVLAGKDPEILIAPLNAKSSELRIFFWIIDYNRVEMTAQEIKTSIYEWLEKNGFLAE
jgi:potassium-dependent mechanosensitive channel